MMRINEIEIKYKREPFKGFQITTSQLAYAAFMEVWDKDTIDLYEEFKVLLLDNANQVIGVYEASKGGISGTLVDIRMILGVALKCAACGIVIAHNHPSGQLKPSQADISLTKKIREAAKQVDIRLFDHLIITKRDYLSFEDDRLV